MSVVHVPVKYRPSKFVTRAGRVISPSLRLRVLYAAFGAALLVLIWFVVFSAVLVEVSR